VAIRKIFQGASSVQYIAVVLSRPGHGQMQHAVDRPGSVIEWEPGEHRSLAWSVQNGSSPRLC
jgi:hypothetical protein